jgi:mannose-1-phosphate guanylyltransferase
MEADEPDPELGYIVAEAAQHAAFHDVRRFVEKPTLEKARRLCGDGALWNSFIVACRVESLIELYRSRCPDAVEILQGIEPRNCPQLADAYRTLPRLDFSRQIAAGQEDRLAVMSVPHCGWNDLGTPKRLAQTLVRHPKLLTDVFRASSEIAAGHLNLAERLLRTYPACVADQLLRRDLG